MKLLLTCDHTFVTRRARRLVSDGLGAAAVTLLSNGELQIMLVDVESDLKIDRRTLTPLPLGRETHGFSRPMTKTLLSRVAKVLSMASLTWTMPKPPS